MENDKSTLTVLMVEPGKAPYQTAIGADLKSLQQVVGGYIESMTPLQSSATTRASSNSSRSTVGCAMSQAISMTILPVIL